MILDFIANLDLARPAIVAIVCFFAGRLVGQIWRAIAARKNLIDAQRARKRTWERATKPPAKGDYE